MARKKTNSSPLALNGALIVQNSAEIQKALALQLGKPTAAVAVDLSKVSACDTAGLQLLCSARQSALLAGRQWSLTNLSEEVLRASAEIAIKPDQLGL